MGTTYHRLLLVHAHPDDESINNGGTIARYVAEGADVTLITCTRGEFGDIVVPELAHLAWDRDDKLGEHRETELAAATTALGLVDRRYLGEPDEYHDSGMMGTPGNDAPNSFWRADLDEAAGRVAAVIREVRPHVLVTYDEHGGYGHPDHIKANLVAMRAAELAEDPAYRVDGAEGEPHRIAKIYWNCLPRSVVEAGIAGLRELGDGTAFEVLEDREFLHAFTVPDRVATTKIDVTRYAGAKTAALRAHATQLTVREPYFALSNDIGLPIADFEYYRLVRGDSGPIGAEGYEKNLFD